MILLVGKKKNLARRYYANVIDYMIFMVCVALYVFAFGEVNEYGVYTISGFGTLIVPLFWFIYFPVFEGTSGQTIGKKALHLYVVDLKGESPWIGQAFLRRILDMMELACWGIPALLTINYSEKNQRLGDMLAGTTVIRTDAVCQHCNTELELTPREVIRDSFTCPTCNQLN